MSSDTREQEIGVVVKAKRYLLTLSGLPSARINDIIIDLDSGHQAIVRALSDEYVFALVLTGEVQPGDRFGYSPQEFMYSVGDYLYGRVIDALGRPVDNKGSFPSANVAFRLDVEAPGIEVREHITQQLVTGVSVVDTLIPIAKGQRQLMFGPMRSGKSTFLTRTVQAQAVAGTVCIYTVIGKPITGLKKITEQVIDAAPPDSKVVVLAAVSDEPASLIAIAPSVAFLLAEYFQAQGEDVLVVLDDLDAHAKYLREIALLEGRLPSTESYPGDIFYQHAHLMERSGDFTDAIGGGSITALPVIQTDLKNFSDLIPTNVMACTDGHLSFSPSMRAQGVYPSINIAESVTRVGRQAQRTLQKQVTRRAQRLLGQYRSQMEYAQFSSDLNEAAQEVLRKGGIMTALLEQRPQDEYEPWIQVVLLSLVLADFFTPEETEHEARSMKEALVNALRNEAEFSPLEKMVSDDNSVWEGFLDALRAHSKDLRSYVSHS